jgi:Fe-S cluster biogenesis protein NfuA
MSPQNLRVVGDRIEQLLDELHATADPPSRATAEALLRSVTELYGGALEQIVRLAARDAPEFLARLFDDELIASLLIVHGLHPDDVETRIERALESVRPFLAEHDGNVELLEIDTHASAVHLRLVGSFEGCRSSTSTLQLAVEAAVVEAAPEILIVDIERPPPPPSVVPVTIGRKPAHA